MNELQTPRFLLTSALLQAGRHWRRLAEKVLAAHDISEARSATLLWVHRLGGGVRQVVLAAHVGVEKTSIVRLLDELAAIGLIERRDDPNDRRANCIWLTEAGERLAEQIEAELIGLRNAVLADVSDADVEAALRVFGALERAVAEAREQGDCAETETPS